MKAIKVNVEEAFVNSKPIWHIAKSKDLQVSWSSVEYDVWNT